MSLIGMHINTVVCVIIHSNLISFELSDVMPFITEGVDVLVEVCFDHAHFYLGL